MHRVLCLWPSGGAAVTPLYGQPHPGKLGPPSTVQALIRAHARQPPRGDHLKQRPLKTDPETRMPLLEPPRCTHQSLSYKALPRHFWPTPSQPRRACLPHRAAAQGRKTLDSGSSWSWKRGRAGWHVWPQAGDWPSAPRFLQDATSNQLSLPASSGASLISSQPSG